MSLRALRILFLVIPSFFEERPGVSVILRKGEEEVLGADVVVLQPLRARFGSGEQRVEPRRKVDGPAGPAPRDAGLLPEGPLGLAGHVLNVQLELREDLRHDPLLLPEERVEEMLVLDLLVAELPRDGLGAR